MGLGRCSVAILTFLLIASMFVRAAVSATMPMSMLSSMATTQVLQSAPSSDAHTDCPGHSAQPHQNDTANPPANCALCGDCCVVAPLFTLTDASGFLQPAPQQHDARYTLPPYSYLTPGIDRPPAAAY